MRSGVGTSISFVVVLAAGMARSGSATATNIFIEAESARLSYNGSRITSPLLIKDDDLASDGSYIEVLAGNDSKTSMPSTEGVTSLNFENPGAKATFTLWARVIAATDGDDSFWLKMDGGSAINWNNIPLGATWHWVHVKADGASNPAQFSLATGTHTLKIGYREDGTKLDAFIVTSDASYDPNAALTGPPATPIFNGNSEGISFAGTILSWQDVPGAQSYTLTDQDGVVLSTGLTSHTLVRSSGCYRVIAVGTAGSSPPTDIQCGEAFGFVQRKDPGDFMSVVAPMKLTTGLTTQSPTTESLSVVPAHGRGRYDFRIAGPTQVQIFAEVGAPNLDSDSFWVRMDLGPWIKWNNISPVGCVPVSNSDAGGAPVVFTLNSGSHFFEFAYREIGTTLFRFAPTDDPSTFPPCED